MGVLHIRDTSTNKFIPITSINGLTPHIGENGNWWVGNVDTGTSASGAGGGVADSVAWGNVTGKPDTYPPAAHTHSEYLGKTETAANANQLNGNSADKFAQIDLEEPEDAGDILLTNADLLAGKSLAQIMLMMYPVGAIYTSTVATSPAALFGGTWERILGKFLFGADDNIAAGSTGGEAVHTLTEAEIPSVGIYDMNNSARRFRYLDGIVQANTTANYAGGLTSSNQSTAYAVTGGGGEAHNNMPPYLSVYMWKRTA